MERKQAQSVSCGILLVLVQILWTPAAATDCIAGSAGIYPCNKVNLLSHLDTSVFGTQGANEIWGWTDPASGTDYALLGLPNGVGFVDLSDPSNPVYLGSLPTQFVNSGWRDIKVFEDHAYIVSEGAFHGMQVFDLNRLTTVTTLPVTFSNDAHYNGFTNAHNIAINEDSGMAYAVGTNTCSGGLHAIDINNKTAPVFAGCYGGDGYTHDAQCVTYTGPDPDYQGHEICVALNEDTVTTVNMSNPQAPVLLSRKGYAGSGYTHQGWFTEDQTYFLVGDEDNELTFGHNTRTYVWDFANLDNPILKGFIKVTQRRSITIYTFITTLFIRPITRAACEF